MFLKDCDAVLDYCVDWREACAGGLSIVDSQWSARPAHVGGVTVQEAGIGEGVTTAHFGGGMPGHVYHIGNRVTLSNGQVDERSFTLRVEER